MKDLGEVAENYFNTLNPIAERISTDILAIKEAYEDLWNCLSAKERNQIINETVVHPEVLLKYTLNSNSVDKNADHPLHPKVTGSKYVVDEGTGVLWRDEHSAPFSWKTPSQIDLTIFTSSNGDIHSSDGLLVIKSKGKLNQHLTDSLQSDENFDLKFENSSNGIKNQDKSHDAKKSSLSPESSNVVLVGTCSKLSGLCSKFKFLPGKSYSYEVQTVVTNPSGSNDGSLLDKIKATAVLKFQSTLKLMGGKTADKKLTENKDTENLVQCKSGPTVIRMNKASPKIAKPKSPPPPPPVLNLSLNSGDKDEMKAGKNLIFIKSDNPKSNVNEMDSEKITLLEENSMKSFSYADLDASDLQSKVVHEISDDFNSLSTECTPLSGPSTDVIPKSGFDFLDNW